MSTSPARAEPRRAAPPGTAPGPLGAAAPAAPAARGVLVVRLRNWVGDVLLGLPLLQRLSDAGYELQLVGKGWAGDLLAGHGWPVHALPKSLAGRVRLLRGLRGVRGVPPAGAGLPIAHSAPASSGGGRRRSIDALCLPYSFSSALEFRLAGWRALGHAHEGRSLLLGHSVPLARGGHELAVYWQLGDRLLGQAAPLPASLGLAPSPAHRAAAAALRAHHGIGPGYIVVCPFAGGTFEKLPKTWPAFAAFVRGELGELARAQQRRIIVCPGPGEEAAAERDFDTALCLPGVSLGTYAALLADAALMISNDTGPGHMAAAVHTPLLSVLGPTDPARWGAWGPSVHVLGGCGRWPEPDEVMRATRQLLALARPTSGA